MVDIKMLQPGTKLKVVDQWPIACGFNHNKNMDKYLGQVVTVLDVRTVSVLIEEDAGEHPYLKGGHFYWNLRCFEYIVEYGKENTEQSSSNSDFSFIFYNGHQRL